MYTIQFKGGPQVVGFRVGDDTDVAETPVSVASVVGDAAGTDVAETPVSVASVVGDAAGATVAGPLVSVSGVVGEASTGRDGVAVGKRTTIWVGDGGVSVASSWLNRKAPTSIPILTSVMAKPLSSGPVPPA